MQGGVGAFGRSFATFTRKYVRKRRLRLTTLAAAAESANNMFTHP